VFSNPDGTLIEEHELAITRKDHQEDELKMVAKNGEFSFILLPVVQTIQPQLIPNMLKSL